MYLTEVSLALLHQVGQEMVSLLVASLQKDTCMAWKETGGLTELSGTEEFQYIRKYRRFSQVQMSPPSLARSEILL